MSSNATAKIIRLILQGLSIVGGLIGAMFFFIGGRFLYSFIGDKDYPVLLIIPFFFLIGGYLIYVAYIMIRNFSSRGIKHFCIMISLALYSCLEHLFNPLIKSSSLKHFNPRSIAYFFIPLVLAIIFYKIAKKVLPKLTDVENNS